MKMPGKIFRCIVCILLCLVMGRSFSSGPYFSPVNAVTEGEHIVTDRYEIWTASSTRKIIKETEFSYKEKAQIDIDLGITAKTDIGSYYMTVGDLKNASGGIIGKENITVYNEYYYFFAGDTVDASPNYYKEAMNKSYPDALIPVEYAKKAGEMH